MNNETKNQTPFILVFHPHQRPGWAEVVYSEDEFLRDWQNGAYANRCNAEWDMEIENPTFADAWDSVGHDLHGLTRLDSREEYEAYMHRAATGRPEHNPALGRTAECAAEVGWADDDED